MTTSRASLCALVALALSLSACSALDDEAAPTTIDQDVLSAPASGQTARPTTPDTDATTATGDDREARSVRGEDRDVRTATGEDLADRTSTGDDLDAQSATAGPTGSDESQSTGDGDLSTATGSQDTGGEAGSDESSPAATTTPGEEELPEMSVEASDGEAAGDRLLPTVARIGVHSDYDRVVFDLEGEGTPGYVVSYVDSAVEDGSGRIVDVDGDAILQVVITGTRYPGEDETYEGGPGTYSIDAADVVEEVRLSGTFEGRTQAFLGIDDENLPFRVFTLSEPARLVVDVAHEE